jgi:Bardet-Biedl syndrome 5 protein
MCSGTTLSFLILFQGCSSIVQFLYCSDLKLTPGETTIEELENVEDTKGNNGLLGKLTITNLRIMWTSAKYITTNLAIGHNCVTKTSIRLATSKLRGQTQALFIHATYSKSKYEFVFTYSSKNSPRMFTTAQTVIKAYQSTKLYRELKLRGSFLKNRKVLLLPDEILDEVVEGVWNLAAEQGHLGTFHLTNIRLIWTSAMNDVFNMSLPYIQIMSIISQKSKFGQALVVETHPNSGSYLLGFRHDPPDKLLALQKKLVAFWKMAMSNPIYGIRVDTQENQLDVETKPKSVGFVSAYAQRDDVEIIDEQNKYFMSKQQQKKRSTKQYLFEEPHDYGDDDIVYDTTIGLAVEKLKEENTTLEDLWNKF